MIILPAINIYDDKVVRLTKGDYEKMTVYSLYPLQTAMEIENIGAKWVHIVDLQGAKGGYTACENVVYNICQYSSLKVQIGGGIRTMEALDNYISSGVSRVVIGTKAVTDEEFLKEALDKYGDKIAVGVDIKDGKIAVKGWTEIIDINAFDFIKHMKDLGVKTVLCTDVSKDGMLGGSNINLYREVANIQNIDVVASGGISSYEEIAQLKELNMYGAVIGKAFYEHKISIGEALKIARE